jgi:glutathione S-transferase
MSMSRNPNAFFSDPERSNMKLYYYPGACALADHIVLEWIGATYDLVEMNRTSVKSPEYLALNPNGNVPLLQHGDFLLTENVAILVYLAELHPEARLLGDGTPRGRAEVLRWLAFLNSDVHGAFKPIFSPWRFHPDEAAAPVVMETARTRVREWLARVDAQLEGRDWLTGARSIADPCLFVMLRWAVAQEIAIGDNLVRFLERMYDDADVEVAIATEEGLAAA